MLNTIIFDLDGTLTDPKEGITRSIIHALDSLQVEVPSEAILTSFIGPPLHQSFASLGLNEEQVDDAIRAYRERFIVTGMYENKVYEGVPQMLAQLKARGFKLAVATSKPKPFAVTILKHFELDQYFDVIAGSNLDGTKTAKADVITLALSELGDVIGAVMIGDRKHDIIGAKVHGLTSIGVTFGYGSYEELEQAGADKIVSSVAELQQLLLNETDLAIR